MWDCIIAHVMKTDSLIIHPTAIRPFRFVTLATTTLPAHYTTLPAHYTTLPSHTHTPHHTRTLHYTTRTLHYTTRTLHYTTLTHTTLHYPHTTLTRQGSRGTKWQPTKDSVICNVHYARFKGPTKDNKDVLPFNFKRPRLQLLQLQKGRK